MREGLIELAISAAIALVFLAVAVWEVATGRIAYMDGIALTLISLTIAAFFGFNIFWSVRKGELQSLLKAARQPKANASASDPETKSEG